MLTVEEAFRKFKSRLELNDREQANASARQTEVREFLRTKFAVDCDFLTGSYKRWTKTKPLRDIDIFFVLSASEKVYRSKDPSVVIDELYDKLLEKYDKKALRKQSRSVNISFGVIADADDNTDYRIVSVDVVPAFAAGNHYEIPDTDTGTWIRTNPKLHEDAATAAHQAYGNEWKGLVRMVKYWNNRADHGEQPVKPSFLVEVMALQCLHGGWSGRFDYEIQALFATLADRIFEVWPDPAGLGPPVSDGMDAARKERARAKLQAASREASLAIHLARQGRNGDALRAWRALFGPKFPLS